MNRRTTSMLAGVAIAASPALAADLQHRKLGLWEVKYPPGQAMQYCIDAVVDKLTLGIAGPLNPDDCQKIDMQVSGDTVTLDFACTVKGRPATAHTVVNGSFDSAYTMTTTAQSEDFPRGAMTVTVVGTWLSSCAADQRPGDIVKPALPNGRMLNLLDMYKAKSPML